MWVGETYYPDAESFITECNERGLNKAIPTSENQSPPVVNPGLSRVFIVHPNAIFVGDRASADHDDEPDTVPGIVGYSYVSRVVVTENEDGDWAQYQKDLASADYVDLVRIGEPRPADADANSALSDFGDAAGDGTANTDAADSDAVSNANEPASEPDADSAADGATDGADDGADDGPSASIQEADYHELRSACGAHPDVDLGQSDTQAEMMEKLAEVGVETIAVKQDRA